MSASSPIKTTMLGIALTLRAPVAAQATPGAWDPSNNNYDHNEAGPLTTVFTTDGALLGRYDSGPISGVGGGYHQAGQVAASAATRQRRERPASKI